jgi:RNA polymerase sigma-70 factor (ECF subfamily)
MDYASLSAERLAQLCAEGGPREPWEEFVRRFNPLIARVALRTARRWTDPSRQMLEDLVQETYLKLCEDNCRLLRHFEVRQPDAIYGYLKIVTANIVHDHFKGANAIKRGSGIAAESSRSGEDLMEHIPEKDPAAAGMDRTVLMQQIDQHLAGIVPAEELPRSRLIFWLYFRSGLSASAIAACSGVSLSTKGVESAILRMTRGLRFALAEPVKVPAVQTGIADRNKREIPIDRRSNIKENPL